MPDVFRHRPEGAPYDPRGADGFQTWRLSPPGDPSAPTSAVVGRIDVPNVGGDEWAISTFVRTEVPRDRATIHGPIYLVGTLLYGHGDRHLGERLEFDWRQGVSLRVSGTHVQVECRYETIVREGTPPVVLVAASISRGGSPARGEVTRTLIQSVIAEPGGAPRVVEIPRRASAIRLVCRVPLDYGRFVVQFWEEPTGVVPVLRWVPTSPTDEIPIPHGASDFSVLSIGPGVTDCDAQFVLEL